MSEVCEGSGFSLAFEGLFGEDVAGQVFALTDAHDCSSYAARYDSALDRDYMELLIEWSAFDPPDERELERTFAIAEQQGAVDPYVVCPDAVDRL